MGFYGCADIRFRLCTNITSRYIYYRSYGIIMWQNSKVNGFNQDFGTFILEHVSRMEDMILLVKMASNFFLINKFIIVFFYKKNRLIVSFSPRFSALLS